jgi:hypothetical protein
MTRDEAIQRLALFNLKAARLERSKFRAWMIDPNRERGHSAQLNEDTWHVRWAWPEDEDVVDAYLLTLRMFVQETDVISVHKLPELYRAVDVEQELLEKITTEVELACPSRVQAPEISASPPVGPPSPSPFRRWRPQRRKAMIRK